MDSRMVESLMDEKQSEVAISLRRIEIGGSTKLARKGKRSAEAKRAVEKRRIISDRWEIGNCYAECVHDGIGRYQSVHFFT